MSSESIGMIGLGLLGTGLAERILGAGFRVVGFDIDPGRRESLRGLGGAAVEAPREVSRCGRIVFSLPDSNVVAQVVDDLLLGLNEGTIIADTTTGDPRQMERIGALLGARGVRYLDATVGGSSEQARRGEVIVMVGGDADAVDACRDLFAAFAKQTFYLGPCGSGARMKLVANLVLGLNRAVLAEGLAFARVLGLDAGVALEILQAGPTWSRVMDTKGRKMLDEDFTPQARLKQHLKDVRLILESGAGSGARLPFTELHARLLERLEAAGFGDADNSAILKAFDTDEL